MAESIRVSAGMDLGSTHLSMAVVQQRNDNLPELLGFGTESRRFLRNGKVVNLESMQMAVNECLKQIQKLAKKSPCSVTVNLPVVETRSESGHVSIDISKRREIKRQDMIDVQYSKTLIESEDWTLIHVFPEEYAVDEQGGLSSPVGMNGKTVHANIQQLFAPTQLVDNIIHSILKSKLQIEHLVIEPIPVCEALITPDELHLGIWLIDIGGEVTHMAGIHDNRITILPSLAIGGCSVTSDIAIGLRTTIRDAERIKVQYGTALSELASTEGTIEIPPLGGGKSGEKISPHMLTQIIQPRMEEIFEMVAERFHNTFSADDYSGGIILSGGGSLLKGTNELAEKYLQLPIIKSNLRDITGLVVPYPAPLTASAIGLALYGLRYPKVKKWGNAGTNPLTRFMKIIFSWFGGDQNQ